MASHYQQIQPSVPQRAYLPTSAGPIPYNPASAQTGAAIVNNTGGALDGNVANTGMTQYPTTYASATPYGQGHLVSSLHGQSTVPQTATAQPAAIAPMTISSSVGAGTRAGVPYPAVVGSAANGGAIEAAEEEAQAEAGIRSCWGCCGPAAAPGGAAETVAGGPVGPDAAAAPGPPGAAGPAGERIVEYFKSGYNSAAAGANANNGLPTNIAAAPAARQGAFVA